MKTFSDRLKFIMRKKNLTQTELAKLCNVSQQAVQYIASKNVQNSKLAPAIAKAVSVNIDWLLFGVGEDGLTTEFESNKDQKTFTCLSGRLNYALSLTNTSKAELARMIGVKPQTINYLCSAEVESSKFTFELAHALRINFEWLAIGRGEVGLEYSTSTSEEKKQHKKIYTFDELRILVEENYSSFQNLKLPFEVQLMDQSMWPRFPQGTILIFNQNEARQGNFVLVYLSTIRDIVFRELVEQDSRKVLVPFNSNLFKKLALQDADIILGILFEARWRIE